MKFLGGILTLKDEKDWVRSKLDFLTTTEINFLLDDLIAANRGNLQTMNNDIEVIKVLCHKDESKSLALANLKLSFQMSAYEIEDKILLGDSKNAIKIICQLKKNDPNSVGRLLWVINKITHYSVMAKSNSNAQSFLQKVKIWSNKIPLYMKFLNKHENKQLDKFNKQAFLLDQYWKGSKKGDIWHLGETYNAVIGQGFTLSTPLQIATMISRIATGKKIKPSILRKNETFEKESICRSKNNKQLFTHVNRDMHNFLLTYNRES